MKKIIARVAVAAFVSAGMAAAAIGPASADGPRIIDGPGCGPIIVCAQN
ncbi:hypothetical protein [Nocardiopsis sp. LOL_012]